MITYIQYTRITFARLRILHLCNQEQKHTHILINGCNNCNENSSHYLEEDKERYIGIWFVVRNRHGIQDISIISKIGFLKERIEYDFFALFWFILSHLGVISQKPLIIFYESQKREQIRRECGTEGLGGTEGEESIIRVCYQK